MDHTNSIVGLLNKLSAGHTHISWSVRCCFADGKGNSLHQIHLRWRKLKKEKIIAFQMETGKVIASSCRGVDTAHADTVIDLLLDLINEESLQVH